MKHSISLPYTCTMNTDKYDTIVVLWKICYISGICSCISQETCPLLECHIHYVNTQLLTSSHMTKGLLIHITKQTQWWPRHKAIYFSWLGPRPFCLLLGPPGFNCWFSFAPVLPWCCSTPLGPPSVGRNTLFLSSPHLCFIIVLSVIYLFPWWVRKPSRGPNN